MQASKYSTHTNKHERVCMQATASKRCKATVASVNNTQSAARGLVANGPYGSLEIVLFMNGNQSADV